MGKKDKKKEEEERKQQELLREAERLKELEEQKKPQESKEEKKKNQKKDKESKNKDANAETKYKYPPSSGAYQIGEPDTNSEVLSDDMKFTDSFKERKIRSKFIRKVYSILTIQLAYTMAFNIPFLYLDEVQEFVYDYPWVIFICLSGFLVPYLMLVCCESTRRNFPTNIILLFIMTQGMAGVCGYFTAKLDTEVVFYAFVLTVVVTVCIMAMAIFCPFDFGSCFMITCVVIVVLAAFAAIACVIFIVTKSKILNLVYAGICVVLFSVFLLFDTKAIIGGRRIRLSPEEYLLGAIQIYVDIVEIFLNFLELVGACTDSD